VFDLLARAEVVEVLPEEVEVGVGSRVVVDEHAVLEPRVRPHVQQSEAGFGVTRRRHQVAVLRDAVALVELPAARPVEHLTRDAQFVEHRPHLGGVTEVLGHQQHVQPRAVEPVLAGVLDVRTHAIVLPYRRDDDADVLAHLTTRMFLGLPKNLSNLRRT
jgi:hypothetical protein